MNITNKKKTTIKINELMENKTYNIDSFQMTMEKNGFPKGFILNRDLTFDECKHIMEHLLGIILGDVSDFFDMEEYNGYCDELVKNVNDWLRGDCDDDYLMYIYAYGDDIGVMSIIPVIEFLQERNVLKRC